MEKPDYLTDESKNIWDALHKSFTLKEHHDIVLKTALEAYDRLQQARQIIDKDGAVIEAHNGYYQKNPMLQIEKEARSGFLAAWKALNIDIEPPKDLGRPPNDHDLKWKQILDGGIEERKN